MYRVFKIIFVYCALIFMTFAAWASNGKITNMRCEYLKDPLGIDVISPRFTWEIVSDKEYHQISCRVSVATSPDMLRQGKANMWKSQRINGSVSRMVYKGKPLQSHTRYYWQVEVWGTSGHKLRSEMSSFETAKLSKQDWKAQWISDTFTQEFRKAPLFRKSLKLVDKPIDSARLYVSGIGYYEFYINGVKVGDRKLEPGYTHFDKRVLYSTYDVTELLQSGDNVLAAELGNGWLNVQSLAVWQFLHFYCIWHLYL